VDSPRICPTDHRAVLAALRAIWRAGQEKRLADDLDAGLWSSFWVRILLGAPGGSGAATRSARTRGVRRMPFFYRARGWRCMASQSTAIFVAPSQLDLGSHHRADHRDGRTAESLRDAPALLLVVVQVVSSICALICEIRASRCRPFWPRRWFVYLFSIITFWRG